MTRFIPWGLALRNVRRDLPAALLVAVFAGLPVAVLSTGASTARTASFTPDEVATIAMGDADVLARPAGSVRSQPSPAPRSSPETGIDQVLPDQDLDLLLRFGEAESDVTSRLLAYTDPLTTGMVELTSHHSATSQLALSPAVIEELGVKPGDVVQVGVDAPVPLTFTDTVVYAADTHARVAIVNEAALSPDTRAMVVAGAADIGGTRWLLSSSDTTLAAGYLASAGFSAATRTGYSAHDVSPPPWFQTSVLVLGGVSLLIAAAGLAALSRAQLRQTHLLTTLGCGERTTRSVASAQAAICVVPGTVLGSLVALAATPVAVTIGQKVARQRWGPVSFALPTLVVCTVCTVGLAIAIAVASTGTAQHSEPRRPKPHRTGSVVALAGRRLAGTRNPGGRIATAALSTVLILAGAVVIVADTASINVVQAYEPQVRDGQVLVTTPRLLTSSEVAALGAQSNSVVFAAQRAAFTTDTSGIDVPVVVADAATECRDRGVDRASCSDATHGDAEVAIATSPADVEGLLGRALDEEERQAFVTGDGLLLRESTDAPQLVPIAGYPSGSPGASFSITTHPRQIVDQPDYLAYPALVISSDAAARLGLFTESSAGAAGSYIVSPLDGRPTTRTIRDALPEDLKRMATVHIEDGAPYADALRQVRVAALVGASSVSVVVVILLMVSWTADTRQLAESIGRLGGSHREIRKAIWARGWRLASSAIVVGVVGAPAVAAAFLLYAGGSAQLPGFVWIVPTVATVGTGLVMGHILARTAS